MHVWSTSDSSCVIMHSGKPRSASEYPVLQCQCLYVSCRIHVGGWYVGVR